MTTNVTRTEEVPATELFQMDDDMDTSTIDNMWENAVSFSTSHKSKQNSFRNGLKMQVRYISFNRTLWGIYWLKLKKYKADIRSIAPKYSFECTQSLWNTYDAKNSKTGIQVLVSTTVFPQSRKGNTLETFVCGKSSYTISYLVISLPPWVSHQRIQILEWQKAISSQLDNHRSRAYTSWIVTWVRPL